jgi:glycosyltransferase involved in cell wall biosynthesis
MAKQKKIILYVNFTPYENAGNILDYLTDHFETVILFSFRFHAIAGSSMSDTLFVFRNKTIIQKTSLLSAPIVSTMTFYLLPVRSALILMQVFYHAIRLYRRYGAADIYFTVNAYTAWLGNILRTLGIVKRTIFWVWDYYPPVHKDFIVRSMRWLYWQFDKPASTQSDKTVFLNKRLASLRKRMRLLPSARPISVVPIGTNPVNTLKKRTQHPLKLVFFGVLKKSQGLDMVFDAADTIIRRYPNAELHIIGTGPDMEHFQQRAQTSPLSTTFHGYVARESDIRARIASCDIGLALYIPDVSNVSFYTDPSKIKAYLSSGVPVIMTDVLTFSQEIASHSAGKVISHGNLKQLTSAITTIAKHHKAYAKHALSLAHEYTYNRIYPSLFADV